MVPLEDVLKKAAPNTGPAFVPPRTPAAPEPAEPRKPREPAKFKVVDVMTNQVLSEGANGRAMLNLLTGIRSVVDVRIYTWEPKAEKWRMLTFGEQRAIWGLRNRR